MTSAGCAPSDAGVGIAGVIEPTCRELAVSLYPAGGFTSLSFAYVAAEYLPAETADGGTPIDVLYIGDYDPAGVLIDGKIEDEMRTHLDPRVRLTFRRIGITAEQIIEYDLPTKPRNKNDRRARHIERTVEAEAMPAGTLRELLRSAIEDYLPEGALHAARVAEQSERAHIKLVANALEARARRARDGNRVSGDNAE